MQLKLVLFVAAIIVAVAATPISAHILRKRYVPLVSTGLPMFVDLVRELTISDQALFEMR